jgi:hypothetical protein
MLQHKKFYLNIETSLFIEASFTEPQKLLQCSGRTVNVEVCEMDTLLVEGVYYEQVKQCGELVEIREV